MYTAMDVYQAPQMKTGGTSSLTAWCGSPRQDAATASSFVSRMMICAPAGKTMSESLVRFATPAPAPAPTLAASPEVTPRPLWIVSSESTDASIGYEVPRTVMLATLNVKVPGVLGLGAGLTSAILPLTTEPAGMTTRPAAFFTSSTTRAVKPSPTLAVRDEIVSVAAMSIFVPAPSRAIDGGAGGVGRRVTGGRVAGGGAAGCGCGAGGFAGTSCIWAVDSVGASVKLRAVESAVWLWSWAF